MINGEITNNRLWPLRIKNKNTTKEKKREQPAIEETQNITVNETQLNNTLITLK